MRLCSLFNNLSGLCKTVILSSFLILAFNNSYAGAPCCSQHGGVAKCHVATGHQQCKDGTDSPTCMCKKTTSSKSKATATPSNTKSTTQTPASTESSTGCCSNHGGIDHCNKSKGMQTCKDGTVSPSCSCK